MDSGKIIKGDTNTQDDTEISNIDKIILSELKYIEKNKAEKINTPNSGNSANSDSSSGSKYTISKSNALENNVIKIITTDKLKNYIDSDSSFEEDEEEEYCNKIGEEKAADLFLLQENLKKMENNDKPIRYQILESGHPDRTKAKLLKMYDMLTEMNMNGEYFKTLKWIEGALKIPFNNYSSTSIGYKNIKNFLIDAQKILDNSVYGHTQCKDYILQLIAQYLSKDNNTMTEGNSDEKERSSKTKNNIPIQGRVFGIQGPPGNGKTSLIRNGICKALQKPFTMIALGGISDGSLLDGHDYTYEGSKWGRLVQCLMDAKCMDPVIYFDELDKVSDTAQGDEIIGILTHLVDFTQNDKIQDRYFNGIDLDFSRCIFIFSFNDESKINKILLDRIQTFYTYGFNEDDKIKISQQYLLPQICENFTFSHDQLLFSPETIRHIINNHTDNEEGIREIKKKLELIILKFNYNLLVESESNYRFPFSFTVEYIDSILKNININLSILSKDSKYSHLYL